MLVWPLIAWNELHRPNKESDGQTSFQCYFSICAHEEASRESLFVFTEANIQSFIAQSISSIQKYHFSESTSQHVGNENNKICSIMQGAGVAI